MVSSAPRCGYCSISSCLACRAQLVGSALLVNCIANGQWEMLLCPTDKCMLQWMIVRSTANRAGIGKKGRHCLPRQCQLDGMPCEVESNIQDWLQERFKDLEKEAKIKPFAKAGLQQKEKVEPAVEAKMNCETWLRNCIACLAVQIEQFEVSWLSCCH